MNLVAHQLLSFQNENWQLGNYLGEMVRGKKYEDYQPEIQKGILLHREIDSYTDTHPEVRKSTARLHKNYGKFSGVIVDIFYDYLLIKNWDTFSEQTFENFKENVYHLLGYHMDEYSAKLQKFTYYLIRDDWYEKYSTLDGIDQTLRGMSARTKFPNNMYQASKELYLHEDLFEQDFLAFFPDIIQHSKEFLGFTKTHS